MPFLKSKVRQAAVVKPSRILIVEDETIVSRDIANSLQMLGYEIAGSAVSGDEAVMLAGQTRPDLVLMDIVLQGGMDGIEAARAIHEGFDIPIVYLTAYSDDSVLDRVKITDPFGYLIKPFATKELQLTIEMAIYRHKAAKEKQKINRILGAISKCNNVLVFAENESDVFREITRIIVDSGGYAFAWAGLAVKDRSKTISPVAQAGDGRGYLDSVSLSWAGDDSGGCPCGSALRSAMPIAVQHDSPACPGDGRWRDEDLKRGFRSSVSLPLISEKEVFGALNVYSFEPDAFEEAEFDLLVELSSNLSYCISSLRSMELRRKTEARIKASEEKYKSLVELSADIIYRTDADGIITFVNDAAVRILGAAAHEIIGSPLIKWVHPENAGKTEAEFGYMINRGADLFNFENMLMGKNGKIVHMLHNIRAVRNDGGAVTGAHGIARDITERKEAERKLMVYQNHLAELVDERTSELKREIVDRIRAESALRESEDRYRSFVQNFQGIAYQTRMDNRAVFFHGAVEEITGYAEGDFLSGAPSWESIINADDAAKVKAQKDALSSRPNYSCHMEYRIVRRGGGTRWIHERSQNICNEKGSPLFIQGAMYDVTERKILEEELLKTQKLESLGIMAGGIAHDFNNILTSILSNVSLIRLTLNSGGTRNLERLMAAEKAAIQARNLTQQLLTFSKGGAPVKRLSSIADMLRESSIMVLAGSKAVCKFDIPAGLWPVEIDEGQMNRVISNLVINANQAMPSGGEITVSASNVEINEGAAIPLGKGPYLKISIKDQGIGIPKNLLDRIFDPYFSTKHGGSGLGLTTTYSVVKKHDGHISVESESGEGTVFHIYLPASPHKAVSHNIAKAPIHCGAGSGSVLIMDDDKAIRESLGEVLSFFGYEVSFAENGRATIEIYARRMESGSRFAAVILDLTVPGEMGGLEALAKLKEIDPDVKAVVSSGYFNNPVMSEFAKYGFHGVITKPYKIEDLNKVLQDVINGKGQ